MTKEQIKSVLDKVFTWPEEDQKELVELAREIEARRRGFYVLNEDEQAAISKAREGQFASDDEVDAFWKRHRIE